MMCSNKKAAFRRPGQYVKKMHNSSDDVRLFLAIPTIIVEHAFETNYRKCYYICIYVGVRVAPVFISIADSLMSSSIS
jgi:hypothetical protein